MHKQAMLYDTGKDNRVHCRLCAHRCAIDDNAYGFCGVRYNRGGRLVTETYGRALAQHVDPIEKKPLYHFLPGSRSYSVGAPGCNFRCDFCQNWQISQPDGPVSAMGPHLFFGPEDIVSSALSQECASIAYTYTEPTIFFEYAYDTAKVAKEKGLANVFVTNGYMTSQALETIAPFLDAANVDLKAWEDTYYHDYCKGRVKPVLGTIERMKKMGIWVEVTTLIIPGENDSDRELNNIAGFIATLDRDMPWHVSRFHPQYKFGDRDTTPVESLDRAVEIARDHGLRYVYQGNVLGGDSVTACPDCGNELVVRTPGVRTPGLDSGRCRQCDSKIEGVWKNQ